MPDFKNTYGVNKIVYRQTCRCHCPIGKTNYTNNFTVYIGPQRVIPDYCEIDRFIRETLEGKSLVIEEAAFKLKRWIERNVDPAWITVESTVMDAAHGNVTVTV